ncbi:S1/P1 nuclease [Caulobacter sp. S45]|uniref:S1/P1 nuclease n=1 Tax=Caulobacter sp. S45 TaxID=1641861 RepID=UPI00157515CE|nr:S1/P1 nuclease [Caulobacter sp. S45]
MRTSLLALVAAVLLLCLSPVRARAWDPEADRVVAQLALERLTPSTRAQVSALLGSGVGVAGCPVMGLDDSARLVSCLHDQRADFMRDLPYPAVPLCGAVPPARWCPNGRCASQTLKRFIGELKDPATPQPEKVLALEAVAYLIAELHQPLHAADNADRSGERVRVTLPGALKVKANLYTVWNDDLVASAIGTAETGLPYVRALADAHGADWSRGDVDDWVAETHDVALHTAYGRLPDPPACNKTPGHPERLTADYFAVAVPAVRIQLAKAGVRLASVLNATLP